MKFHFISTRVHHYDHYDIYIYIYIYTHTHTHTHKISPRKSEGEILSRGYGLNMKIILNMILQKEERGWLHQLSSGLRPKSPSCRCDNKVWSLKIR